MPAAASQAFASRSCALGTISGVIALFAGRKNTLQAKSPNTSAYIQAVLWVAEYSTGIKATSTERSVSETMSTRRRFQRSTQAPVKGAKSSTGASMMLASSESRSEERGSWKACVCSDRSPSGVATPSAYVSARSCPSASPTWRSHRPSQIAASTQRLPPA